MPVPDDFIPDPVDHSEVFPEPDPINRSQTSEDDAATNNMKTKNGTQPDPTAETQEQQSSSETPFYDPFSWFSGEESSSSSSSSTGLPKGPVALFAAIAAIWYFS